MSASAPVTVGDRLPDPLYVGLRAAALIATVIAVLPFVFNTSHPGNQQLLRYHIDFDVYRNGGRALLDGIALYTASFPVGGIKLPFTYPPLAAILFVPTAFLDRDLGAALLNITSVVALWWCLVVVLERSRPGWSRSTTWSTALVLLPIALRLEPVAETLNFAQANILLMLAVIIDVLGRRTVLPRGTLIGLAAAIKLTPAVFGLYFLVRGDWRSAGVCVLSGIGFTAVAWTITPSNSVEYWLHTISDPDRIGQLAYTGNQSLRGVLARTLPEGTQTTLWLMTVGLILPAVIFAMIRAVNRGAMTGALLLNATVALLCSPVAWTHHWVWLAPLVVVLGFRAVDLRGTRSGALALWLTALFTTACIVAPQWTLPYRGAEVDWSPGAHLIGNTYVLLTLILIGAVIAAPEILGGDPGRLGGVNTKLPAWPGAILAAVGIIISSGVVSGTVPGVVPVDVSQEAAVAIRHMLTGTGGNADPRVSLLAAILFIVVIAVVVVPGHGWRVLAFSAPVIMLCLPVRLGVSTQPLTLLVVGLLAADAFAPRSNRLPGGLLSGIAIGLAGWPLMTLGAIVVRGTRRGLVTALVTGATTMVILWPVAGFLPALTGISLGSALNASPVGFLARTTTGTSPFTTVAPVLTAAAFGGWVLYRLHHSTASEHEKMAVWFTIPLLVLPMVSVPLWSLAVPLVVMLMIRTRSEVGTEQVRSTVAAALGVWMLLFFWPPTALEAGFSGPTSGWNPLTEFLALLPAFYLVVTWLILVQRKPATVTAG
ncbi:glycosyltransferase 87 family protein [Corynebacterium sp. CCM 9203]|uniref:glycosyltransferase 87 family protein n=1 Tax=Corynebacterium sp. CCM 9203 TaxID=3057615 RepID=UPI00352542FF